MKSIPRLENPSHSRLLAITGRPPSLINLPQGCRFAPRCPYAQERCREEEPPLRPIGDSAHLSACHFAEELEGRTGHLVEPVGAGA